LSITYTSSKLYSPSSFFSFSSLPRRHPRSTLFPYTTLFRSSGFPLAPETPRLPTKNRGCARRRHEHCRCRCRSPQGARFAAPRRSEEHTSELQSHLNLVCRLLLEKKKKKK